MVIIYFMTINIENTFRKRFVLFDPDASFARPLRIFLDFPFSHKVLWEQVTFKSILLSIGPPYPLPLNKITIGTTLPFA